MRHEKFFRKESTVTQLEQGMYTAAQTTRGCNGTSRSYRRTLAAAAAFGLLLLAVPSYAQTVNQKESTMNQRETSTTEFDTLLLNPVPLIMTHG
jgi:hypothetical protein